MTSLLSAPSGPPQNVRATSNTSTTITVEWDGVECLQRNTEITGFTVHYDPPSSDGTDEATASGSGREGGGVTLTGLTHFTSYSIEVASDSDLGRGPFSDAITVETAEGRELLITDKILFGDVKYYHSPSNSIWTCRFTISQCDGDHTFSIMEGT